MMQSGSEAYQPTSDSRTQTGVKLSWAQLAFQRRVPGLRVFSESCSSCGTPPERFSIRMFSRLVLEPRPAQQFQRGRASLLNTSAADEYNAAADAQP